MRWFESSRPSMTPPGLEPILEAFEEGDLERAAGCFAERGVYRESGGQPPIVGRPAIAAHYAAYTASGVRWRFLVDDVIGDEDRACVVYRFQIAEGDGETWRERAGCATVRLDAGGQIAEWREYDG